MEFEEKESLVAKNNLNNIDELVNDFDNVRVTEILKRAANISKTVFECTLGSQNSFSPKYIQTNQDLKIPKQNADTEEKISSNLNNHRENFSIFSNPEIQISIKESLSSQTLDFNTIRNNLVIKSKEKDRKENLRKQFEERQQKLAAEIQKRKNDLVVTFQNRNESVESNLMDVSQIFEEAERYAAQEEEKTKHVMQKLLMEKDRKLQRISFEAISNSQKKFKQRYEKLTQLLMTVDKNAIPCEEYNKKLKELISNFDSLIQKLKSQPIGPTEVLIAEDLCTKMDKIQLSLVDDVNKKRAELKHQQQLKEQQLQENARKAATEQQYQQDQQQPQEQQNQQHPHIQSQSVQIKPNIEIQANYVSQESLELYTEIMKFYKEKQDNAKAIELDDNMKKFRVACKRFLIMPVSAISAISPQHLQDKYEKIYKFITGQNVKQSANDVNIKDHPMGRDFTLLLLVKIFISQSQIEVSSNSKIAFPIASVIVSIWNVIPDFGRIFLGQIFSDSPFLVPLLLPKQEGSTQVDFFRSLGYKVDENGTIEGPDSFLNRQTGIVRLFAAIMVTKGRRGNGENHPYSIENAWRFLCNFVILRPITDISALILYEFLQISGYDLYNTYKAQFHKLVYYTQDNYLPKLSEIDQGRPRHQRLETYLQQVLAKGIEKPQGMLAPNYW